MNFDIFPQFSGIFQTQYVSSEHIFAIQGFSHFFRYFFFGHGEGFNPETIPLNTSLWICLMAVDDSEIFSNFPETIKQPCLSKGVENLPMTNYLATLLKNLHFTQKNQWRRLDACQVVTWNTRNKRPSSMNKDRMILSKERRRLLSLLPPLSRLLRHGQGETPVVIFCDPLPHGDFKPGPICSTVVWWTARIQAAVFPNF